MGINTYKIKKWYLMLTGKSLLHVPQGLGKAFVPGELKGYYNDLTEKVLRDPLTIQEKRLPKMKNEDGEDVVFATTIFQYGLGCYDLILIDYRPEYEDQFKRCVDWTVSNQDNNGGWNISAFAGERSPYGAMAQGEGVSLLLRAYIHYHNEYYLTLAEKAIKLLLKPIKEGGTSLYNENELYLMEFMGYRCVLNGWIFALFSLYDYLLLQNNSEIKEKYDLTIATLKDHINDYDNGYWTMYDNKNKIASPFYHKLHIAQLEALCLIDDCAVFENYKCKIMNYQKRILNRGKAFVVKVFQKTFGD